MKKSIGFFFVLWLLIADLASAGDYVLVIGKGIEVCEVYLKNLNSFSKHPPMVCDRPLHPKFPELKKPDWQPVDITQNLDLLRQVEQTMRRMADVQWDQQKEQWASKVKERVAKGWLVLDIAHLDVDRDGTPEPVLRYVNDAPVGNAPGCDPMNQSFFANPSGIKLFVLTPDRRGIDETMSRHLKVAGRLDIFLFKGRVYLTTWAGNLGFKDGQLSIYTPLLLPGRDVQRCDYRYVRSTGGRQP